MPAAQIAHFISSVANALNLPTPLQRPSPLFRLFADVGSAAAQAVSVGSNLSRDQVLVLGRLSDDPGHDYEGLKPLLDYVVARMGDVGIVEGRILMARDASQMAGYLRRRRVDWVTDTAVTAVEYRRRGVAEPTPGAWLTASGVAVLLLCPLELPALLLPRSWCLRDNADDGREIKPIQCNRDDCRWLPPLWRSLLVSSAR